MNLGPLIIDLEGVALSAEERERLLHPWVGGVILFSRNFESIEQLEALTASIHRLRPLLITVDHEGGRIQRFRDGFTALPSFRSLSEGLGDHPSPEALSAATQLACRAGTTLATELRASGIDFSYTPVLDLDHGRSAVIGDRAFHRNPHLVSMLAAAVMQGLRLAGFHSCGKHFPGHGWATADSHHALPVDDRPLEVILADDASPYAALGKDLAPLSAVMPAHIRYTAVDDQPAGFSRTWLREILRGRLNFDGVIISDDLSMAGAAIYEDISDRAQAAFEAGCDATLICNRPDLSAQALDELPRRMPTFLSSGHRRSLLRLLPDG